MNEKQHVSARAAMLGKIIVEECLDAQKAGTSSKEIMDALAVVVIWAMGLLTEKPVDYFKIWSGHIAGEMARPDLADNLAARKSEAIELLRLEAQRSINDGRDPWPLIGLKGLDDALTLSMKEILNRIGVLRRANV